MSLLDGLLAADAWPGAEDSNTFSAGLGTGGGDLGGLFQFDMTNIANKNMEADRTSASTPDAGVKKSEDGTKKPDCANKEQLCLPSNYRILKPVLRLARENRWVADWVFRLPILAGSTPVSPEMFGYAMVGQVDETMVDSFGVANPAVPKGGTTQQIKTMNVPVSSIGHITIGYSFCIMREVSCPLAAFRKDGKPDMNGMSEPEVFFGRFAFDSKAKELLLVCPCFEAGVTQMMWVKQASYKCAMEGAKKRFRAFVGVPASTQYSWSNLPTQIMLSNVYEEFHDPTFIPHMDFAANNVPEQEEQRAMSPFSSSTSISSDDFSFGMNVTTDTVGMPLLNENDSAFNLSTMMKAISDIEHLFKGQFSSPITLTDIYDPKSGRLVMRKTESLMSRMDRISSPDEDVKFRTFVAQAYYAKYYSPICNVPLLPGAGDTFSSTSSITSEEPPTTSPDPTLASSTVVPAPAVSTPTTPVAVPARRTANDKIAGPAKRIRKAARLAPRPLPVDESGSSNDSLDSAETKEERARKAKEAKAYAKKIRNRESAARSNARRRKHIEAVKKELAVLASEKEALVEKKKVMMEENAKMKANLVKMYAKELKE